MKKDYLEKLNGINIDKTLGYLLLLVVWILILFWILHWHPMYKITKAQTFFQNMITKENVQNKFPSKIKAEKIKEGVDLLLNTKYSPYMKKPSPNIRNTFQEEILTNPL